MPADPGVPPGFSPEEWESIKELVFVCLNDPPANVEEFLSQRGVSPEVRREVYRLLDASARTGTFLTGVASDSLAERRQPDHIGPYEILEELGVGGMGVVYAALDPRLNRRVAVKVLHADAADNPVLRRRLRHEAKAASALRHPNIVTVYDVGFDAGYEFVAMECITGQTLGRLIRPGGMDTGEVLRIATQIARGLESAHAAKIVHRDLKPSNIMIGDDSTVKILDFGLAKYDPGGDAGESMTTLQGGGFAGTAAYASPEQADSKALDTRTDIFSFGAVLYEMVTGQRAFTGESAISTLADILHREPRKLRDLNPRVDPRLEDIVSRCLRKDRERRIQTAAEVRIRLEEIEESLNQAAPLNEVTLFPAQSIPTRRPPRWMWAALVASAAVACVSTGVLWWQLRRGEAPVQDRKYLTRVTADAGLTAFPALSRDGKLLAYASDRSGAGNMDLWVQQVGASEPVQITFNPADERDPAFSPDNTRLVYRSERNGGGLYTMPALGGSESPLYPGGRSPAFSPDGKQVACWTGEPGGNFYPGAAKIVIVPAAGGPAKPFRPDFSAAAYPVWAPSGDRLLFLGRGTDPQTQTSKIDWWIASIDGTHAQATGALAALEKADLHWRPATFWFQPLVWVPEQDLILFSATHGDATNVWGVHLGPDGKVEGPPRRLTSNTGVDSSPTIATVRGGPALAYATLNVAFSIFRVRLDSHGKAAGAPERLVAGFDRLNSPSASSDGKRVVFASRQPDGQSVRVIDLDTGRKEVIASVLATRTPRPVISGDGESVAYSGADNSGLVVGLRGGATEKVCNSCGPPTHLSFNGRDALFESPRIPEQLLISADRGAPRPLIRVTGPSSELQYGGRFSPDHRWIVYWAVNPNTRERRLVIAPVRADRPVGEEELIPLTKGPSDSEPFWSPDGRHVYFLSGRDGFLCVWSVEVDPATGKPRGEAAGVAHFHHAHQVIGGPSAYSGDIGLSVTRQFLVLTVTESSGNIWLQTASSLRQK